MQKMRQALQRRMTEVPEAARGHPEIQAIAELTTDRACNIVHLIYQSKAFEGHSKDYEFGPEAMREHWQSGLDDIRRTRADPQRLSRPTPDPGIVTPNVHRLRRHRAAPAAPPHQATPNVYRKIAVTEKRMPRRLDDGGPRFI